MNDINNIFYKPDIAAKKDYYSDGEILSATGKMPNDNNKNDESSVKDIEVTLKKSVGVIKRLYSIRNVIKILPVDIKNIITDIIEKIICDEITKKNQIEENVNNGLQDEKHKNNETVYEGQIDQNEKNEITETLWPQPISPNIVITFIEPKSASEQAMEQYLRDSVDISEKFTNDMEMVLNEYLNQLLTVMSEIGLSNIQYLNYEYDGEQVSGFSFSEKHLHDSIVRSQTIIKEQTALFKKTHSAEKTLTTIKSFEMAAIQRVNYYKEDYIDGAAENFVDMFKNDILERCRKQYDVKYSAAKMNMYKYLNSTVIITSDMLKLNLQANISKCYLLNKDINIFEKKKYAEGSGVSNAADSKLNEITPNSKVGG